MDDDLIIVKNVKLEFLTTKTDDYDNEVSYFKMKDKTLEQKMNKYDNEDYKLPWFKSEKGKNKILKVKCKYIKIKDMSKNDVISVDLTLKYYEMNDICGFYVSSLK